MPTPFEFQLQLTGNFAAALAPVNKGLGDAHKNLGSARGEVHAFEAELGKLSGTAGGVGFNLSALAKGGSIFTFDLAEGARAAVDAVKEVIGAVVDLGKEIVHVAARKQDLDLGVKLNLGDEGAKQLDTLAEGFSNTRFSPEQVKSSLLPLLRAGERDVEFLGHLATTAADIAAKSPDNAHAFQDTLDALSRISIRREVNPKMLSSLAINEKDFYANLADLLKVSVKQAESLTKSGKVASRTLLSVVEDEIAKKQGGAIGAGGMKGAETLGGTLDRLSNLGETLLGKLADSPGIKRLQEVLDNFITVMSGPEGTKLMSDIGDGIADLAKGILGFVSGPDGLKTMVGLVRETIDDLKGAWHWIGAVVDETIGGIQVVKGSLMSLALGATGQHSDEAEKSITEGMLRIGRGKAYLETGDQTTANLLGAGQRAMLGGEQAGDGVAKGIDDSRESVRASMCALGDAAQDGLRSSLEIHSPSRVMMDLGGQTAAGFALGLDAGRDDIGRAMDASIGAGDLRAGRGDSSLDGTSPRGGTSITINAPITIEISSTGGDGASVGREAAKEVRAELLDMLDEIRAGHGAGT